jgi:hypothetical protein
MTRIILPTFYCPFPSQLSPLVEEVHQHTLAWATRYDLLQKEAAQRRFDGARYAWLAARTYPQAGFAELALTNDFFSWLFLLDDQFDDGLIGRQPERMQTVIQGLLAILGVVSGEPLQGPLAHALYELWARMLPLTTPQWRTRFIRHLLAYFDSYGWETRNRASGNIPDVEVYIEVRQDAGAMRLALDYMDLTEHIDLPVEIYQSSLVQVLLRLTNNIVCWSNDIFSLEKELARGDLNNLVLAIQQERRSSLQEAVERVNELITREVRLFQEISRFALAAVPDYALDLQKYLAGMQAWIRGNLDWSLETQRYSHVEPVAPGETPDYLEDIFSVDPEL